MAEIINLRHARKAKAKRERAAEADANRIKFGRTKGEREISSARNQRSETTLDAHKIEDEAPEGSSCT